MFGNGKLSNDVVPIHAFVGTPSSASPTYISLKDVKKVSIVLVVTNGTTVTGTAVTINQATAVAGTSAKALAFTKALRNIDTGTNGQPVLSEFTVTSNTFTTDATNSKKLVYVIDIDPASLDVANGFDCIQVGLGNAANTTVAALYLVEPQFGGNATLVPAVTSD